MLTAHLPSGYILGKSTSLVGWTFIAALVGSVFPDLDMIFFYFIDNKAYHHHRYWVHIPFFWVVIAGVVLPIVGRTRFKNPAIAFLAAIAVQLLLDSIGGGIMWTAPFSNHLWEIVTVPARQSNWISSFILHWTFLLELVIWIVAIALYVKGCKGKTA